MATQDEKRLAAHRAVDFIESGMIVGLGSGSTSAIAVRELGRRVQEEGLSIQGIPTSEDTRVLAESLGIPLTTLASVDHIDVTIDGADEVDPYLRLIKGGGGALLREKIVASYTRRNIIMIHGAKWVERLGAFPLPVEVIPFAEPVVWQKLHQLGLEGSRRESDGHPFFTDEGNLILDLDTREIRNIEDLNRALLYIPGVVETGYFLDTATTVIVARGEEVMVIES